MPLTNDQLAQQKKEAEELLFSGPETLGFAKGLFFGSFNAPLVFPYPELKPEERETVPKALEEVRRYVHEKIDAAAIDRNAEIPADVVAGLSGLGVLGFTCPTEYGGRGFSQLANTRIMEIIGGHCSSCAVFINAHHSIGIRALLLFGTDAQKKRWLPELASGRTLAAFALTEPEAGSDASNVQTTAIPTPDGKAYILNGLKHYITNGGIAGVLTVMARTPDPDKPGTSKVTAFLVTPDLPGFEVIEARMPKCGIRGTATGKMAFKDMPVPAENMLGPLGKGLRVALTVLDFGRTTFGAGCVGTAKFCLNAATEYARKRVQFKQPLGEFELVKKKIAFMAANAFAMEATTTQCAGFIDSGAEDYMLETAMLKVWSTDALWQIVNDTMQIYGGKGYFSDQPFERIMRDNRINLIGEGANDVLRSFIALVGMRGVGEKLKGVLDAVSKPFSGGIGKLWKFGKDQVATRLSTPDIPVRNSALAAPARNLGKRVRDFGLAVQAVLRTHREGILVKQYVQERIADAACDLYAASCTLSRLDSMLSQGAKSDPSLIQAGQYFLTLTDRRIKQNLAALWDNDDDQATKTADAALRQ